MDAGYEIWYGVLTADLMNIAGVTPDGLIDLAAAKFGPEGEGNRIRGEREFFGTPWDKECFFQAEYSASALVLFAPRPGEDRGQYGFGVELVDSDWDFPPRELPLGMPTSEEISVAHNVFVAAMERLFPAEVARALATAARCWITPYYL